MENGSLRPLEQQGDSFSKEAAEEQGAPVSGLVLLDAEKISTDALLETTCEKLAQYLETKIVSN